MFNFKEETKRKLKNAGKIAGIAILSLGGLALIVWGIKSGTDDIPTIESYDSTSDDLAEQKAA